MSRNTVENVIRKFGSQQRVAELLGIWQTAVSGWVRRGAIPTRRQEELLAIARREGLELAPADFFVEARGDGTHGWPSAGAALAVAAQRPASSRSRATPPIQQGPRTAMTATTAEVIELKQPAANRIATKDLYEIGEIPPLGHVPGQHVCLGDPQGPPRRADLAPCSRRWCRSPRSATTSAWSW